MSQRTEAALVLLLAFGITVALLFAYWYARTARLWPLIVARALQDFTAWSWIAVADARLGDQLLPR